MRSTSTTCHERALGSRSGRGFTLVSAIFIVVVLAALGAAVAALSQRQHLGAAAELQTARAVQAARAGLEWAAWQVLRNPAPPAAAPACPADTSFAPGGLDGFTVTVRCSFVSGSDGPDTFAFYTLVANACNAPAAGACPAAGSPGPTYVERQLTWTVQR